MRRYNFRLEKFLKYRELKEKLAHRDFINQQNILEKQKEILKEIKEKEIQVLKNESKNRIGKIDLARWRYSNSFLYENQKREYSEIKKIQVILSKLDELKKRYIEASRNRKIVEKLKDKSIEEYKKYFYKETQKLFDDIASQRFKKKF